MIDKKKLKLRNKKYWKKVKSNPVRAKEIRESNKVSVKRYYLKNRDRITKYQKARKLRLRFEILNKYQFTCQYCGRKSPQIELQIDHIVPLSKGGKNEKENMIVACVECNLGKGDLSIVSFK